MMTALDKSKITLICLPFAGGNAQSYREFQNYVADFVHIKPLDLPGRGKRTREPLLTDVEAMVNDVFQQIQHDINDGPYAIYGHSMGAHLGYLLTKRILSTGLPAPVHLFFSGREAPSVEDKKPPKHNLPKEKFFKKLNELGGFPEEVLKDAMLMEFLEPILRADFKAVETYVYNPTQPFDIPMTLMRGLAEETTYAELQAWQPQTRQPVSIKQFPGGHFFIFDHLLQMGQLFSKTLAQALQKRVVAQGGYN